MQKNVIFIHLESISNTILWQYRSELKTVWRLWLESLRFSNFHSNATSTMMVNGYFMYGSTAVYDNRVLFEENLHPPLNMFLHALYHFEAAGYNWRSYLLDYYFRQESIVATVHNHNNPASLCESIRSYIEDSKKEGKPFGYYFSNSVSHMALDDEAKAGAATFSDRFRIGYLRLDALLNQILSILVEQQVWDNTMIVVFGDHGDEMWSHGLNRGYCHGIPPYNSLTSTPLFIYNSGKPAGDDDRLIQTTDLVQTMLQLLTGGYALPEGSPEFEDTPFAGVDFFSTDKNLVFSQNLFALQHEHTDPEQGLFKGYSVTDGIYRLVVSSGGNQPKEGGLEFYCDRVDPTNSRNLLDFFILSSDGAPLKVYPPAEVSAPDFSIVFNQVAVADLIAKYDHLRSHLYSYVRAKEKLALAQIGAKRHHIMPEKAFRFARKRRRRD